VIAIYLAGASKELDRCETLRDRLTAAGHRVTRNWMADVRANAHRPDADIGKEERAAYARADLDGVAACGVFWLVTPELPSLGAWVELGYALRRADESPYLPLIIVSGPWRSIFGDLADFTFSTHEEALAYLCGAT
jgi:hypothetical protein